MDAPVPLKRGEICYHATTARVRKPNGGVLREGDAIITSKRVAIIGGGVTEIRLDRILKVDVNPYQGSVSFVVDGRENAVQLDWFGDRDPVYFGMLTKLVADRVRERNPC